MRINYYYRMPHAVNFSIENVFKDLKNGLSKEFLWKDIYAKSSFDWNLLFSRKESVDLHHITGAIHYLTLGLPHRSTILTIHDIGHLANTLSGVRKLFYYLAYWDLPLRKTRYITTVSDFTLEQVVKQFPFTKKKIVRIYNPVSDQFKPNPKIEIQYPVILQIGGGANKNIDALIEAIDGLSCRLILVRQPTLELENRLKRNKIDFEFRYNLTSAELVAAYQDCNVLYFASTYEGFGLPIIEAMKSGRPVITSNFGPMKEISGGAACLVDPLDSKEIRKAIERITRDADYYTELVERGLVQSRKFEISKITKEYTDLYKEIVKSGY
jgi:glycosyltransferase involved in cell wall biosynthesis